MNWTPVISMGIVGLAFISLSIGVGFSKTAIEPQFKSIKTCLAIVGFVFYLAAFILVGFAIGVWL